MCNPRSSVLGRGSSIAAPGVSREDRHRGGTHRDKLSSRLSRLSHSHEHEETEDCTHRDAQVAFLRSPSTPRLQREVPDGEAASKRNMNYTSWPSPQITSSK